jgi:hypothetical protein
VNVPLFEDLVVAAPKWTNPRNQDPVQVQIIILINVTIILFVFTSIWADAPFGLGLQRSLG